jgi:hypothetical protein
MVQVKGSSQTQIVLGSRKSGKFALGWISTEFKKCFDLFLAGRLEDDKEIFEEKREQYFKYFLKHLKAIPERTKHIPLFAEFANTVRTTFQYNFGTERDRDNIEKRGWMVLSNKEMNMFVNFFVDKLNRKDIVSVFELNTLFQVTDENKYFMDEFYMYMYRKFDLIHDDEVAILRNPHGHHPILSKMVRFNFTKVAQAETKHRLKNDSWCYHILRFYMTEMRDHQYLFNDNRLLPNDRQLYIVLISKFFSRYIKVKELSSCLNIANLHNPLAAELKEVMFEHLDDITGLEKLTLTSIINSDPYLHATSPLFVSVPDQYKNIRKTILEVKLKR